MDDQTLRHKGDSWNESSIHPDPWTLRPVRIVTRTGLYNEKPTYHTNTSFTATGDKLIFARSDGTRSALCSADSATGDITQLIEPVSGCGGWWIRNKIPESPLCTGTGIDGVTACIAPRTRWAVFAAGRSIRAVHLDSLTERVLLDDFGAHWIEGAMSIDPGEEHVLLPLIPSHPEIRRGAEPSRDYRASFAGGGMRTRYLEIPLAGGPARVIFEDEGRGCAHCPHCPADSDLVLIDRDLPPHFWGGGDDGATSRCWLLRLSTGGLTEIRPRNAQRFQTHAAWSYDGQRIYYHGPRREGGWYIGVATRDGAIEREWEFPDAKGYGHVAAAPDRQAIVLDGNLSPDLLLYLYHDQPDPRIEVIARHGTVWRALPGQYADPHPAISPTGRHLACNVGCEGRTDLMVVDLR